MVREGKRVVSLWLGGVFEHGICGQWLTLIMSDAFQVFTLEGNPDASTLGKAHRLGNLGGVFGNPMVS
jgi:hypothetical protein